MNTSHLKMVSRFMPLLCCSFALLLGAALASSPEAKPRNKRSVSIPSKHSVDDLVLELAKKHLIKMIAEQQADLAKIQHSVGILQRDSCANIKSVGSPVTHNTRQHTQGAWMKDPLGIMGTKIFVMESFAGRKVLEEYENIFQFKAGIVHKKHTLPYNYDGTGAVVYGPYLYYNRENSHYIVKYNIQKSAQEALINMASAGFQQRKNHYQWGGNTGMDLAVDEQGLWALWADTDNAGRLYASKIDVYSNAIIDTRGLSTERMSHMGNAFVACGVVYCIDAFNGRSTTINFAYDFKTGRTWNPNIQFTNQYGYNSMVDYNPREKVLYAWDNKRLVTYPITFEPPSK